MYMYMYISTCTCWVLMDSNAIGAHVAVVVVTILLFVLGKRGAKNGCHGSVM